MVKFATIGRRMTRADHHKQIGVVAASAAAHLGVLALLAIHHPQLRQAEAPPVFEVAVVPLFLPPRRDHAAPPQPLASRPLRPRRILRPGETAPVAPLVTPRAAPAAAGPIAAPAPSPAPAAASDALRGALRGGSVGCANPALLSKDERAACLEKLGAGARDAPFYEPPMSREKRREFDAAAARKEAYRRYKEGNVPPGLTPGGLEMKPLPEVWTPHD